MDSSLRRRAFGHLVVADTTVPLPVGCGGNYPRPMEQPLDYYGYAPLVRPDRPVCLVGLPGSRAGKVARMVSMLSGLPFVWLDRSVEHRAGTSVDGIVVTRGAEERMGHERALLPEALRRSSPHVIALSEVTLTDPRLRDLVRATATLVYVRRPGAALVEEISRAKADKTAAYARLGLGEVDLPALFDALEPSMRRSATVVVEVGRVGPQGAGKQVIDALGWTLPSV